MTTTVDRSPMVASEGESGDLRRIDSVLREAQAPKLVGPHGEEIVLPPTLFHVLRQVVSHLAQGHAISVIPLAKELTTQQAADLLNVSRPFLIKELERGAIPFTKVGTHRRIKFADVMRYLHDRENRERAAMDELVRLSEELGLYDT